MSPNRPQGAGWAPAVAWRGLRVALYKMQNKCFYYQNCFPGVSEAPAGGMQPGLPTGRGGAPLLGRGPGVRILSLGVISPSGSVPYATSQALSSAACPPSHLQPLEMSSAGPGAMSLMSTRGRHYPSQGCVEGASFPWQPWAWVGRLAWQLALAENSVGLALGPGS